jgi:outer membrane protein assembly factor BamA
MIKIRFLFIYTVVFLFQTTIVTAQTPKDSLTEKIMLTDTNSPKIVISAINIAGNKHTKTYIIEREIPFKVGDTLLKKNLTATLLQARNQVSNTNLFTEVLFDSIPQQDSSLHVNIVVKERWYIFPTPQFQLVDRSFNEWIKTYNADFKRVIYGLKFAHYNFSGRRDQFRIYLLNGYARNISASYSAPYSNKKLTEGFGVAVGYTQNREVQYKLNYNNKLLNYRKEGFVSNNFNAAVGYSIRKGFFKSTNFSVGFNYSNIDDSIITTKYNSTYFNSSNSKQFIPDFGVGISYSNTDNNNYPQKGLIYSYGISKRGVQFVGGINSLSISGSFAKFYKHSHNFFSTVQSSAIVKLPFEQAFVNRRAIGFGSLSLRGLEVYLIDGVAAGVAKYTLTKKVAAFKIPFPIKIKSLPYVPFKIFAKTYADAGYSYLSKKYDSRLNNKFLYTGGFGIDIVTFYDIVFKVEYSFNQLGEKGLFLRGKGGF